MKFNFFISCVCSLFFSICFLNNLFSVLIVSLFRPVGGQNIMFTVILRT